MRIAVFDTHQYDRDGFLECNRELGPGSGHELVFVEARLSESTCERAEGCAAVCVFVNDRVEASVLERLWAMGVRLVALRCAGFNNVDLGAAQRLGMAVVRVPEYSPHAVAEHAVGLILALNRKLVRAHARVRDGNFSLDGLVGFDLYGKTVGVVGTGKIGATFARIMRGFGCRLVGYDPVPDRALEAEIGMVYCGLEQVLAEADVLSLHVPLNASTRHLLNAAALERMKPGAMVINTGRGALIDTTALVHALRSGRVGAAGLDVYEEEEGIFFEDHSGEVLGDAQLAWLLMCPNVLVTSHQAFLTKEALHQIARTTLASASAFEAQLAGTAPKMAADQRVVLTPLGS
ncbi:MAG: lactate dehydrogenase [Verrucomicrobiota bacterium]|jgi:D-lactate dehydrogenase